MPDLRHVLHDILKDSNIKNHYDEISRIRDEFNHNIKFLKEPPRWHDNYNCFEFALSIHENGKYIGCNGLKYKLRYRGRNGIFINSDFIQYLIDSNILHKNEKGPIIIYFNNNTITHGGIFKNKLVSSKWGLGNLYQHEIFEVPTEYGKLCKRFKNVDKNTVLKYFNKFVDEHED